MKATPPPSDGEWQAAGWLADDWQHGRTAPRGLGDCVRVVDDKGSCSLWRMLQDEAGPFRNPNGTCWTSWRAGEATMLVEEVGVRDGRESTGGRRGLID